MARLGPRSVAALSIFIISTVVGVYFATQLVVGYPPPLRRPFGDTLAINLTYYYLWGLCVPAVVFMAKRHRFEKSRWPDSVVIHVAWAVVLTLAQILVAESLLRTFTDLRTRKPVSSVIMDNFHSSAPTYFIILTMMSRLSELLRLTLDKENSQEVTRKTALTPVRPCGGEICLH